MKSSQKPPKWLLFLWAGIIAFPTLPMAQYRTDSLITNGLPHIHEAHELELDNHSNIDVDTLYAKIVPSIDMETIEDRASCLDLDMPLVINKTVCGFIHFFAVRKRNYTQTMLERKNYYFPIFEYYLKKHQMPDALKYLSIVESGLNFKARSKAGAVGLWQFMPGTGSDFYLSNNQFIDERQNPYLATEAACKFLKYLHSMFNDWELALAAYNCGPGNVMKAMRKSGRRGFWDIYNFLPQETRSYVPQFHAVVYTMNFAEEHNIKADLDSMLITAALDTFQIQKSFDIIKLETILGLPKQSLHQHNPSLKSRVYPSTSSFPLLVPVSHSLFLVSNLDRFIDSAAVTQISENQEKRGRKTDKNTKYYFAKKGEKLQNIANQFSVEVLALQKWNGLKSDKIKKSTRLKIYLPIVKPEEVVASVSPKRYTVTTTTGLQSTESDKVAETHVVNKGEKLYQVAVRYGLTTSTIKKLNHLPSSKINEGQILNLRKEKEQTQVQIIADETEEIQKPLEGENKTDVKEYVVKKGDRLFAIAKSNGLSIDQLRDWNNLKTDQVKLGQTLKISPNEVACQENKEVAVETAIQKSDLETEKIIAKSNKVKKQKPTEIELPKTYLVQKGDTLYSITKKFTKLSIKDLIRLNNLKTKNIKPGQQLIVG